MYERIKALRVERVWKQPEAAHRICIPLTSYRRYESGKSEVPSDVLLNMAYAYNVSVDYLLGNSDVCNAKTDSAKAPQNFGDMIDTLCRQLARLEKESEINPENLPRLTDAMCNIVSSLITLSLSDIVKKDYANKA